MDNPRPFTMVRNADETGVSGTGRVLDGVVFDDGVVVVHWRGRLRSTAVYPDFETFRAIHIDSHPSNDTELHWLCADLCDRLRTIEKNPHAA